MDEITSINVKAWWLMKKLTHKLKSGKMDVLEVPIPVLKSGMVLVRNFYSLISAGTESSTVKTARKGYIGKAKERPQQVKQVIDTLMSQGPVQTYRAVMKKLDAYSPLGYSCIGEVINIGSYVGQEAHGTGQIETKTEYTILHPEFKVGDIVACGGSTASHAEVVAVPVNLCVKLPQSAESKAQSSDRNEKSGNSWDNDLKMAAYNTLGAIAMQGVRQADLRLGETCAVIGMGLLGQLTATLLKASGVRVAGIDVDPAMVELGREHCLDIGLVRDDSGIESKILEFSDGIGCDVVIITAASDSVDPINFAGGISRKKGTVVVVGAVPTGFDRNPHFYKKELTVKMSCSYGPGRYDPEYEEKGRDYPVAYIRWTEKRNMQAFQELIASGKIDIGYLTTHVFKLQDAPKAYDMIVEKPEPFVGILIKYDPQITRKEKDKLATGPNIPSQTLQEAPHSGGGICSAVTSEFRGPGITPVPSSRAAGQAQNKITTRPSALTIGFIGAGSYAQSYLLPNIPKGQDVVLKGVMTFTSTSSRSVADKFGFEFCTGNEKDILENDEINTVFIATRHDSHGYYVKKALEAGKNVFVEKPLCLTIQELEKIKSATTVKWSANFTAQADQHFSAETNSNGNTIQQINDSQIASNGVPLLMVGYNRRFSPLTQIIKEKITSGPMSMIYRINAGAVSGDSWVQDMEIGGGRILGEVCHFVDYLTFINGSLPVSLFATAMEDANNHNDTLTVSLKYQNGSVGSVQYFANGSKSLPKEYVEVYAHGVTAILNDFRELKIYGKGRPYRKKLMSQDKGQKSEVRLFFDAVKSGGESPFPLSEIFSASEVCFGILESIRTGQSKKLSPDYAE